MTYGSSTRAMIGGTRSRTSLPNGLSIVRSGWLDFVDFDVFDCFDVFDRGLKSSCRGGGREDDGSASAAGWDAGMDGSFRGIESNDGLGDEDMRALSAS
jgi:hypothetical protein